MKCGHCAANLERHEWFCPNCKRGSRREEVAIRPTRRPLGLFLAMGMVVLALSATLGSRWQPLEGAPPTESPATNSAWTLPTTSTTANTVHLATYDAPIRSGLVNGSASDSMVPTATGPSSSNALPTP